MKQAITEHHRLGFPVAFWQDGRVMWRYPDGSLRAEGPDDAPAPADSSPEL